MKKLNLLKVAMLPLLLMGIVSCNNAEQPTDQNSEPSQSEQSSVETPTEKPSDETSAPSTPVDQPSEPEESEPSSDESEPSSEESSQHSFDDVKQEEDIYGMLPASVKNANLNIDFLVYIEGQEGTIEDIGNYSPYVNEDGLPYDPATGDIRKYGPQDLSSIEMARYFGAASAFKKLAPGVKINLVYTSIGSYNDTIRQYRDQYGHLPHIMWATDHVVEMMEQGYAADVSMYSDAEYYDSYNEYFMTRFNFGGFQGGFPIAAEPWGVFVNTTDLEKYYVVSDVYNDNGLNTDAYKNWVDTFTWEKFIEAVKLCSNDTHAGLSKVVEYFLSYSLSTVNEQFIAEGTVDFTSDEVISTMRKLLEYENTLANNDYTVYLYDQSSTGQTPNTEKFPEAAGWAGTKNFCENQYATFYAEAPWSLTTISQYINENKLNDTISVDFLPYPMVDENSNQYTGIAVEGLTIGNQCPVDINGNPECHSDSSWEEQEVAAYFAMFMGADPRAIEANSKVKYVFDGVEYTGSLSLPIVKKGFRYSWQDNPDLSKDDPAQAFADNWAYILSKWFEIYTVYVTDGKTPDVTNFTNIAYGLSKMIDTIYGERVTTLNFWNEPVNVYEDGTSRDIFVNWQTRYTYFINPDTLSGNLGSSTYVDSVIAGLPALEEDINTNTEKVWYDLQDNIDMYYGWGVYDVTDRTDRNDYEGSIVS